ncbi:hypothetical protein, partial [Klebsiella pneumoniae]|uniref:hypothetical protein n=1 Tax=Klebsiella pneumoniae TaxID=573 RepID=UPI0037BF0CA4
DGAFDLNGSNSVALLFLSTMVTDATTAGISIRIYAAFDGIISGLTGFVEFDESFWRLINTTFAS